ncbi:MAG TPA: ABC transporter ATP-binding protein [Nannocystis sp.]
MTSSSDDRGRPPAFGPRARARGGLVALLRASWRALDVHRPRFLLVIALFVLAGAAELGVPWAIGYAVGVFVEHGAGDLAFRGALLGIAAYLGLRFVNVLLHHLGRYLQAGLAFRARMHTLGEVFRALLGYDLHWHVLRHTGENMARLSRSALAVQNVVGQYSWQVLEGTVKVALAGVALAALDLRVAANVFVMSLVTLVVMAYFNRRMVENIRLTNQFDNTIGRVCVDYLANVVTVKTLGLERLAASDLAGRRDEGLANVRRVSRYAELKWAAVSCGYAAVMATSLLVYFRGSAATGTALDVAEVYVLLNYLDKIFSAIGSFSAYYGNIAEACTAFEDATELLAHAPGPPALPPGPAQPWRELSLSRLEFAYPGADARRLRCRGLTFRRGEKIALVGISGGGKSTLLKLLAGVLRPDRCALAVDGCAISPTDLARRTLLIPQEPQILAGTLRHNLALGDSFSPTALAWAAELTCLGPVIDRLPHGWDTPLAESGLDLSGGERQRIALARGLLRAHTRQLLLLDEPTAALDPRTEREVLAALLAALPDSTIIASCHRISLLSLFDRVVCVEDGEVFELSDLPIDPRPQHHPSARSLAGTSSIM